MSGSPVRGCRIGAGLVALACSGVLLPVGCSGGGCSGGASSDRASAVLEAAGAGADLHFVRGGVVASDAAGVPRFTPRAWASGDTVGAATAPLSPECVPLFHVELEDMSRLAAMNGPAPGATLAFSPDGRWLAIGSDAGSLRIVDAETGAERVATKLAEGAVKQVAWSADGATLYVGEQSPDANVSAVDPATLSPRWSVRLADDLETSPLPPSDDVYGLYAMPGVYALRVLPDGDLFVAGVHGWVAPDSGRGDGGRRNRGRVYRLGPDGSRRGAWPASGAADAVLLHPVVHTDAVHGDTALLAVARSAVGAAPTDLPIGGVMVLDLATMTPRWHYQFAPLTPYFKDVYIWEAAGLGADLAFAGLGDGRAFLFDGAGTLAATLEPGVPILAQGVPIAASVGFGTVVDDTAYFLTTSTNIPWGSADPATRPPSPHPAQNTLHAVARDGTTKWVWQGDHAVQGVVPSPDGTSLLVAAAERASDSRTDLYGALLFDRLTGALTTSCSTEGPAYFRPVWAPDGGRIAVSESPFLLDGAVHGAYRVTVFR